MNRSRSPHEWLTLALRATLEAGTVFGLAYWGATAGHDTAADIALGVGAPVVGFGFWGRVDVGGAGRHAELLRLLQELVVSGLAAVALYAAGLPATGVALALLSLAYHARVYALGGTLLDPWSRSGDASPG
ncbi:DUF2568 domain-containing protein [Baekduia soli]|uniref:DUF2568 domain-containing protein n=1 Tax=Baekduia soli TaxID=496014 RepID=A0A5B8U5I0_9ACTN|nr:YrdB family protein [Baekduia soli]QEC48280.1 DUF2568 domain-containing protein [Baekduia soli]